MQCRDVREMADSFLARELLTETSDEMRRHLETCPACRADLAAQRALRETLRRAFCDASDLGPTPDFTTRLRTTLKRAARQEPARRGIRFDRRWVLAAIVVLAVALGFAYGGRNRVTPTVVLARAAVADHRNCALQFRLAEKPISLEAAARRYGVAYHILEDVPPNDVMTTGGPARVLERHACVCKGRRFAHIVLDYRGERVSLIVTTVDRSDRRTLPGAALPRVTSAGRIDDMPVVFFRTSGQIVFFAGDVAQADLVALADAIAGPLYRELAGT